METKISVSSVKNLSKVLVCEPSSFKRIVPINETEKHTFPRGINVDKLVMEFNNFTDKLQNMGVEVLFLPPDINLPQQTFVRDLGFTLNDTFYFGKSNVELRQGEFKKAQEFLKCTKTYNFEHNLEGGDVVIFKNIIFVGISNRTSFDAVIELQTQLQNSYKIVPLKLENKVLHLDTVLNVVGDIIVINKQSIETKFNPYLYSDKVVNTYLSEQFYLPTNFLTLNENTIIANSNCPRTNTALKKLGVKVEEVSFCEMVKLGGSFRCCSMEIVKQ